MTRKERKILLTVLDFLVGSAPPKEKKKPSKFKKYPEERPFEGQKVVVITNVDIVSSGYYEAANDKFDLVAGYSGKVLYWIGYCEFYDFALKGDLNHA